MPAKVLTLILCCLLVSSLAFAQAKAPEKKSTPAATAKTAAGAPDKALLNTILDAWASMNPDNVAKYYDQAPGDVFYDVAPVKYNGWAEYVGGFKQLASTLKSLKFTLNDDATVHHAGTLAWGTATVKTEMTDQSDKTTNLDCRWTMVWQKKGANWVIVHDHFSAPLPEAK